MDKPFYLTALKEDLIVSEFATVHYGRLTNREYLTVCYNFWQMVYVNEGTWNVSIGDKEYCLESGCLLFNPPHMQRQHIVKEGADSCAVSIIGFVSHSCMDFFNDKIFTLSYDEKEQLNDILDLCLKNFKIIIDDPNFQGLKPIENVTSSTLQLLKISFEQFLITLYSKTADGVKLGEKDREIISKIEGYLLENIDKNLSIKEIATHFFISPTSLKRVFKNSSGESIKKHFIHLKIHRAKELIAKSDKSFFAISDELGFDTPSYFTSVFKKEVGITPSEYRKNSLVFF